MFTFLVPQRDKLRHRILGEVVKEYYKIENVKVFNYKDIAIKVEDLCKRLRITREELLMVSAKMLEAEEVMTENFGSGLTMFGGKFALSSYSDEKYLKDGKTYMLGRIKDYVGIPVAGIGLIATIISTCNMIIVWHSKDKLEQQQIRIDSMQAQIKRAGLK